MNDNLILLFHWLKDGTDESPSIKELCDSICTKHGYHTPYRVEFKNLDDTIYTSYDIILSPGDPVTLFINDRYLFECILERRSPIYFRHRLEQALERLPRMQRVLRHLIPLSTAIALKKDAKLWSKIPAPQFKDLLLAQKYLEITYTVTVKDKVTGTEIQLSGEDPIQLKNSAVERLSKTIFDNDDLMLLIDDIETARKHKAEYNPQQIAIGGVDGELREKREY